MSKVIIPVDIKPDATKIPDIKRAILWPAFLDIRLPINAPMQKKHIVMVFHAIEDKDGDQTKLRIKVEGQTKNNVWETQDLGGFVEMVGNDRTIGFSNCEKYFAKGTRGVSGVMRIPALGPNTANDFLTKLFEQYNAKSAEEMVEQAAQKKIYDEAMETVNALVMTITDAESANAAVHQFKAIQHALTSEREAALVWNAKIKELGLFYNKVLKAYTVPNEEGI